MTLGGVALLLLLVVLAVGVVGVWQYAGGTAERARLAQRTELDRVEARAATLRYRFDAWLRRQRLGRYLAHRILSSGVEISVADLFAILVAVALLAYVVGNAILPSWLAVVGAAFAARGVFAWMDRKRDQRRAEFISQLPELARTLSNATAAGRSLASAIRLASDELDEPAATEMARVAEELRIGQPVDVALENLRTRLPSREVAVLVSTLLIQQRSGGDVVNALREMADTLDGRKNLRREIVTAMSGSVFTGYLTAALGGMILVLLNLIEPGLIEDMTASWLGRVALLVAGGLYTAAFLVIRRITRIEV